MRITKPKPGEPIKIIETKTKGVRYRAVVDVGVGPDGKRRQDMTTHDSLTAARHWITETRAAVKDGTYLTKDRTTFDSLCNRWLDSRRDIREVTRVGYTDVLKAARVRLGKRKAQDITRSDIESFVTWLQTEGGQRGTGVSRRTVVFTLGAVRQVLAYAVTEGLLRANPAESVKAPRKQHGDSHSTAVWAISDLAQFRATADSHEWAAGWRLSLCGLRRSEVLGLTWDAIDLAAGTVEIRAGRVLLDGHRTAIDAPKSSASWRTVNAEAIHPGTVALLRQMKARQAADKLKAGRAYTDSGLVLVDALGSGIRPERYSDEFRRLCDEADVPTVRLHEVRHTIALALHRAGQAPADVASLLGHSVSTHLAFYVPSTKTGAQSAAQALGSALSAAG
ncbi:tyrosine-type recombinase/integrase [Rarobacter incanus]|uniref:Site-specific recombinase XerD n=1 Tax=Rarobacter incanus TaxID=153494 RepID=A0A542SM40_9MICO|nr:site-specific integrase [Rarobacter incanus]TQK75704.1 site-specific recombinase XerD [Rarobacter incanus]